MFKKVLFLLARARRSLVPAPLSIPFPQKGIGLKTSGSDRARFCRNCARITARSESPSAMRKVLCVTRCSSCRYER